MKLRESRTQWLGIFAIVCLGAIAYVNSLGNDFQFDDIDGIVRSPILRNARNIPSYFTDIRQSVISGGRDWRPVVLATFALNYAIDGLNPMIFRLTNLAIHIGNACLLFFLLIAILRRRPPAAADMPFSSETCAALAALVFVVHPVNSEVVNHIWARSSALAAFFYLLAFYCFVRGPWSLASEKKRAWGIAGLAFFTLGLGAKATVITLPAVLFLYELLFSTPEKPFWREPRRLVKYLQLVAVSAAYVIFRFIYLSGFFRRVGGGSSDISATTYLFTQFRAWIYYIRLFFWPSPLIADYPGFGWSRSVADPRVLLSLAAILAILVLAWRSRKENAPLSFFLCWYFLLLLPEASFIPLFDAVNGYRAYPAYAGLAAVTLLLSIKATAFLRKKLKIAVNDRRLRATYAAALAIAMVALGATTIARNRDWKDGVTLWSDIAAKDPTNGRAYANLAIASIRKGDYEKADQLLAQAIERGPGKSLPYMYRGYISLATGRGDMGLSDFSKAIELDRRVPMPFYYRGEVYRKKAEYENALADYDRALALSPLFTDAYIATALVYLDLRESDKAIEACRKVMEMDAGDARSYHCLGSIFMEQQRYVEAIRAYQRGLERRSHDSGLWYGLGAAYEAYGMYKPAAEAFEMSSRFTK